MTRSHDDKLCYDDMTQLTHCKPRSDGQPHSLTLSNDAFDPDTNLADNIYFDKLPPRFYALTNQAFHTDDKATWPKMITLTKTSFFLGGRYMTSIDPTKRVSSTFFF